MSAEVAVPLELDMSRGRRTLVWRDWVSLAKPRIVSLLVLCEAMTMIAAARGLPSPGVLLAALAGGALTAGGASAVNCWYDRDIDRSMRRTCDRPLPAGRITASQALWFGGTLTAAGTLLLGFGANWLAAALALGGAVFYAVIYTMVLKRSTPLNIVIGGAAGAFPPLVGWAAVQGTLAWPALALFAVIFLWTPPHFWSLALLLRRDYDSVNVPMLPSLIGARRTHRRILLYIAALVFASEVPALAFGARYAIAATLLAAVYLGLGVWASLRRGPRAAVLLFHWSLAYLALLFVAAAVAVG
ncbi:MAG: protoheme IX farnesyltransferase [Candidatus Dormibacteraeota bacterium]|nr:protoheme IX farnesyltransferase [Candidatus Dormibacteraeota bacterium]